MSGSFKRIKGFADIYGSEAAVFTHMESCARKIFGLYGFDELRTPILESTSLFQRSIGSETDVVQKEMFTFPDRKGRSLTMRPEATAGVMRACIEEGLARPDQITRLFTIGPMFRYERPQKGRMRQFHQINCECLGTNSPYADAELICMLLDFLASVGISGLKLKLNSLGCRNCRPVYMQKLRIFLESLDSDGLCMDCRQRMHSNPLRILDCKQPHCKELAAAAPKLMDNNCDECSAHMETVVSLLKRQNVNMEIDHCLVRGLDYYFRTTFEVVSDQIGAQTAVAGGGRYDGLISQLGGEDVPGVGFACGMERLALLAPQPQKPVPDFYMLSLGAELKDVAFDLTEKLRKKGFSGEMNYMDAGFKGLMRRAARSEAKVCLILGPDEAAMKKITLKNMKTGEQGCVDQSVLDAELAAVLEQME